MSAPARVYYLDTSVLTTALVESISHHSAALDYCQRIEAERAPVCFSELLRLEYAHFLRVLPSQLDTDQFRSHGLHRWNRSSVRERWFRRGWDEFDAFIRQFAYVAEIALSRAILDSSQALMVSHNLGSYDATHVATALAVHATELASVDGHFSRASDLIPIEIVRDASDP